MHIYNLRCGCVVCVDSCVCMCVCVCACKYHSNLHNLLLSG